VLARQPLASDAGWTPAGGRAYQRSEVCALIRRRDQGLRLKVPLNGEDGRAFRAQREEPLAVFDDHTLGPRKVERPVGSGPITDEEWEPCVARTALPFAVRPMEAWGSGGRRDQEFCPLGL
jgi:hypothetical protein